MPSLSEKHPEHQALSTAESVEPSSRPTRTSWFSFSKSQWLLVLIALYAVGLMGFDAYSRLEGIVEPSVKGLCPVQPQALGKGPGWVSEHFVHSLSALVDRLGIACSRKLHRYRHRTSLSSRPDRRKPFLSQRNPLPNRSPSEGCLIR